MTADSLMNLEANKYKIRLRGNEWNAKSESETKLMSLQRKDKSKGTVKNPGTQKRYQKITKKPKSEKAKRDKPAWMTKAPSATEKGKFKTIDSKDYWWATPLHAGAATILANAKPKGNKEKRTRRNLNSPVRWKQSHTTRNPSPSDPKRALRDGYVPCWPPLEEQYPYPWG